MKKIKLNTGKTFLLGLGIIAVISLILKVMTPTTNQKWQQENQTSLTQQNLDASQSTFEQVEFQGQVVNLPQTLPVVSLERNTDFSAVNKIITTLNLQAQEGEENIWSNQDWFLVFDPQSNSLILSSNKKPNVKQTIDQAAAIQAAADWLTQLGMPKNLVANEKSVEYFEGEYELETTTADLASFVQIPFTHTINSYPFFIGQDSNEPYLLILDSDYQLQKLAIHQLEIVTTKNLQETKTLTIDQAIENIKQKQVASVISVNNTPFNYSLDEIEKAVFSEAVVEYRLEQDNQTVLPYYRLMGKFVLKNQQTIYATAITPAIEI